MTASFEYRLTRSTEYDLRDIWIYSNNTWGEEQADRYVLGLKNCCKKIGENPALGKLVNEIGAGLRMFRCQYH